MLELDTGECTIRILHRGNPTDRGQDFSFSVLFPCIKEVMDEREDDKDT